MKRKFQPHRLGKKIINQLILLILFVDYGSVAYSETIPAKADASQKKILSYADIADLTDAAPIVAIVHIESAKPVSLAETKTAGSKIEYRLVTGKIDSLIRGEDGFVPKISFLVRSEETVKGQRPKVSWRRGASMIIFARPGPKAGTVQLVSRNAAQPWSDTIEATARAITTELLAADTPPVISAVGDAFHVSGTVNGESETQIFLKTATGAPVSLSILHRPDTAIKWGVSLGEIVDDTAVPPSHDTLLWYRLACTLPAILPPSSVRNLTVLDAEAARKDYRFVMEGLGSCDRTL